MRPLPVKEKEYRQSLLQTERRSIIPIKWFVWFVTLGLWQVIVRPVPTHSFIWVFVAYAVFNLIETYLIYSNRVGLSYIRLATLISYMTDVSYVTMLVFFNFPLGEQLYSEFYILYFLLVLRGFALFTSVIEMVLVNALISILFILMIYLQQRTYVFVTEPAFAVRLVLIWLVLLMAWFIMVVLNQQKLDLIRVHETLMRADNLARIGELAAGVAHEINNPLGIIIANTEYLKRVTPDEDPRVEDIDAIYRETIRCRDIVQQMLTYANPKPRELSLVSPTAINNEILNFVFPRGRTGLIEVLTEYAPSVPMIRVDPNLLKQALLNVYINARQAIPEGRPGRIVSRVLTRKHPPSVVFEIEDNGSGISADDIDHVFDPFFTRKAQGTGLGLPMTQRILESFGGSIALQPAHPTGTRARIELPQAKG